MSRSVSFELISDDWRLTSYHVVVDVFDDNIDVWLEYGGQEYSATFFTARNVERLMHRWVESGEQLAPYFWARHAINLPSLEFKTVRGASDDLIRTGEIAQAMSLRHE